MAGFQSQTFNLAANTGYVFSLPHALGNISLLSRIECFVQLYGQGVQPQTPTSAAIPGVGAASSFYHMLPSEDVDTTIDPNITKQYEFVQYIAVWAVSAGYLTMMGVVYQ